MPEQHLRAINIAHPRKQFLVHQQRADAALRTLHLRPHLLRIGIIADRIFPDLADGDGVFLVRDQPTPLRAAQIRRQIVGVPAVGVAFGGGGASGFGARIIRVVVGKRFDAQSDLAPDLLAILKAQVSNQAQVDIDDVLVGRGVEVQE